MDVLELKCTKCEYKKDILMGTHDSLDTLSDPNEDYAYFKQFICPVDKEIQSIDVLNPEFEGNCAHHNVKLESLEGLPKKCPKCGGPVKVEPKKAFKELKEAK